MKRLGQSGFTLIEVTIALAIFALSAAVLYESFATAQARSLQVKDREFAALAAQSLLDQWRAVPRLDKAEDSGQLAPGWTWRIHVAPYAAGVDGHFPWQAFTVTVAVSPDQAPQRGASLQSVELARVQP